MCDVQMCASPSVVVPSKPCVVAVPSSPIIVKKCDPTKLITQLSDVVRHPVVSYHVPSSIIVVGRQWPCWLPSVLALRLPLAGAFFPSKYHQFFVEPKCWSSPRLMTSWRTFDDFTTLSSFPSCPPARPLIVLASGTSQFLDNLRPLLGPHHSQIIFCVDKCLARVSIKDAHRHWNQLQDHWLSAGFGCCRVRHADFGGATSSSHLLVHKGVPSGSFSPRPSVPRVLRHLLNSATPGWHAPLDAPAKILGDVLRAPIKVDGLLRQDGLLDAFNRHLLVACPSVFSTTKWVQRKLSPYELLRAYDIPIFMDKVLLPACSKSRPLPFGIENGVTPLVVTAIFSSLWGTSGGGLSWMSKHVLETVQVVLRMFHSQNHRGRI
jgi:hypothetical protein